MSHKLRSYIPPQYESRDGDERTINQARHRCCFRGEVEIGETESLRNGSWSWGMEHEKRGGKARGRERYLLYFAFVHACLVLLRMERATISQGREF